MSSGTDRREPSLRQITAVAAVVMLAVAAMPLAASTVTAAQTDTASNSDYAFAFVNGSNSHVTLLTKSGEQVDLNVSGEIVGPVTNLDDDAALEVPYVTSQEELHVIDGNGEQQTLATNVSKDVTKLGVGDWDDDGKTAVFYASTSNNIERVEYNGTPHRISDLQGIAAIGVTDYDSDGDEDLVYVGESSSAIKYYDNDTVNSTGYTSMGQDTGLGVGAPADFNQDGQPRVPVISGSSSVALVSANGSVTTVTSDSMDKAPVAAANWTGDASLEAVHLKNSQIKATTLAGATSTVYDASNNSITAAQSAGIATVIEKTPVQVNSFTAANESGNVSVTIESTESLDAITVSLSGPESATLDRSAFTESRSGDAYVYEATYNASTDGTYTASLDKMVSADGDTLTDVASDDAVLDLRRFTIQNVTLTDATNHDGTVNPSDTVRVTATITGDVDTVTADLSGFDAGTITLSPTGEDTYAGTATVGSGVTMGDYAATVSVNDGEGNVGSATTDTLHVPDQTTDTSDGSDSSDGSDGSDTSDTTLKASEGSLNVTPPKPNATATHAVTLTINSSSAGSWNGLRINYSGTGADISNVDQGDIAKIGIDRNDNESGTTVDTAVQNDLSTVSGSGDGTVLTVGLGGSYDLDEGDELVVVYEDVQHPSEIGSYSVALDANPQSTGGQATASFALDAVKQMEKTTTATVEKQQDQTTTTTTTTTMEQDSEETTTTTTTTPGFGVIAALVAALAAAALVRRS